MKNFKGLSLEPVDVLKNIGAIIESGHLLAICHDREYSDIGDMIIDFARDYAVAAHSYALEKKK
ncbi:TPA: hypothetical protein L7572_005592 [Klebsiella variicola]|nr:hypothetical protein [Klebsiella variicola]HBQ5645431.1 hypothetical protein [Klebsiella variicola]